MLVSILIPTLNRRGYLSQSLASALAQDGAEIEVLVSDDGSTDGTRDYVAAVAAADGRVRLLTDNPVPGIFSNVEHLKRHAAGDAFTVLGDDDLLDPDFVRLLAEPLADPSVILSFTDHRVIDADGRELTKATRQSSVRYGRAALPAGIVDDAISVALRGGIWLGFTLYRTSAFSGESFDAGCGTAADWDYAIRAASRGRVSYVAGRHASYRDHRQTASRQGLRDAAGLAVRVLEKHAFVEGPAESLRRALLRDALARHAFRTAPSDRDEARRLRARYRALGGSALNPRFALSGLLVTLPSAPARTVQRAIWAASGAIARARGAIS